MQPQGLLQNQEYDTNPTGELTDDLCDDGSMVSPELRQVLLLGHRCVQSLGRFCYYLQVFRTLIGS